MIFFGVCLGLFFFKKSIHQSLPYAYKYVYIVHSLFPSFRFVCAPLPFEICCLFSLYSLSIHNFFFLINNMF